MISHSIGNAISCTIYQSNKFNSFYDLAPIQLLKSFFSFDVILYFSSVNRYASRVRSIVNDPNKNVSSKEVARLKRLVAYWKEQAGKKGDYEELEEIREERLQKDRTDNRHSL